MGKQAAMEGERDVFNNGAFHSTGAQEGWIEVYWGLYSFYSYVTIPTPIFLSFADVLLFMIRLSTGSTYFVWEYENIQAAAQTTCRLAESESLSRAQQ